jgi:DNA-binding MarR family transcriptional regulator
MPSARTTADSQRSDVADLVCACGMVRRAARAVSHLYDSWLRPYEIEASQFAVLATLARLGPINQAALGRRFDLDKTTVSRNVRMLEKRGWITCSPGAGSRERRLALSARGRRQVRLVTPAWRKAQRHFRSSMGTPSWDGMWSVLKIMTRAARTAQRRPAD